MKKSAAYMINDTILLQAMSLTETGLWIAYGEVFSIRADEHEKLTTGILKSLANSIEDVAHPPQSQWKDVQRPILEGAGVKTWAARGKKAKSVGIESDDNKISMIPTANFRDYRGEGLEESAVHCSLDEVNLSSKLLEAFQHAS